MAVVLLVALAQVPFTGCGKKGPPLAPLRLVPAPVSEIDARRSGAEVEIRFGLPTTNLNGPGPIDLSRVEIYAVTIAAGATDPPNRDLLTKARLVGTMPVKPPPVEGEPEPPAAAPADTRPAPGERVVFVEELTAEKLEPAIAAAPAAPAAPPKTEAASPSVSADPKAAAPDPQAAPKPAETPAAAAKEGQPPKGAAPADPGAAQAPAAAVPPPAKFPMRVYAVRGITGSGRPGQPVRVRVPVVATPAPPTAVAAQFSERAMTIDWTPPVAEPDAPPVVFNIYPSAERPLSINKAPIAERTFEQPLGELGKEHCFVVRSVQVIQNVPIESPSSAPACVTPKDIFPPPAPGGLQAVPSSEGVSLSWDVNPAADLGGYVLLRGEAPGDTLQPLMREPIRDTTYRDTTVTPGVEYIYAVVAVDRATPPNTSPRSPVQRVVAR